MPQIVCNIALDVSVNDAGQKLMAKQGDFGCRLLCVQFTDCKKPLPLEVGTTVLLNAAKGEEKTAFLGSVTGDGKALFVLPDFILSEAGSAICDVSAITKEGGRLTTAQFEIVVDAAVCPSSEISDTMGSLDLVQEFLTSQSVYELVPDFEDGGYVIRPKVNRKYAVDLSEYDYAPDGFWAAISLELPTPVDHERENWVVLYFHAPITEAEGGVPLFFEENVLFSEGMPPLITMSDFEIICTYSPLTRSWRLGVVQYGKAEGEA